MANTKAAQKYIKQSGARRLRNRQQRSTLRNTVKGFRSLMETSPTQEAADQEFSKVTKALDQAAAKNLIHKNAAARTKSRLSALKKKTCSQG